MPWATIAWVSVLLLVCYGSLVKVLIDIWLNNEDMGHGMFVPVIAGYIAWQKRDQLAHMTPQTNWWGLAVMFWALLQLYIGTLGAELFLARTSLVISIAGVVLLVGGTQYLKTFAFPIFLLFFMVPIPAIIYNQITFPLQLIASAAAEKTITILQIPVIREGNILELANQKLNVVEACSGIRSLLTLTFLSLVYGYFFEKRNWVRVFLFFATIPIAIVANAGRVTLAGVFAQYKPEWAEGLAHEAQGWVIFMVALMFLLVVHQTVIRVTNVVNRRTA
jgi:exosortase